ncbi:hypothetical protein C8F01DRAFT_768341 [Mycena amicta]|nr:hypothetical protein C8F01DRAFT_768341 [Mycena amicta]
MRNADDSDVSVALTQLHNGWIRVSISVGQEAPGKILQFATYGWLSMAESLMISDVWLSQAGHVFSSLNIRENFDSHVIIAPGSLSVEFTVPQTVTLPPGYLFLCPPRRALGNNAQASEEDIAYWSPDPLGRKRLSRDEAYTGGFPNLAISRDVGEFRWDASTYEEIRAVHVAKGFDPDSQDIARHLGYPLFELVSDIKARKRTSFFNEEWKDDGWTLADLFGVEPEFSEARAHPETSESCYERALLKARGILTLCETVVPQVMEGFAILSIALAVWIELSR